MTIQTVALILAWPVTVWYVFIAVLTMLGAWIFAKNPRNDFISVTWGASCYLTWRKRLVWALVLCFMLSILQGWITFR